MVFIAFEIVEVIFIGLQRMESNRWWLVPNVEQLAHPLLLLVPGVCVCVCVEPTGKMESFNSSNYTRLRLSHYK